MGALMHNLAVLGDAERHNVVGHDGMHYPQVGLLGVINIRDKIPDFGVHVAGKISLHILRIGIVDSVLLEVAQGSGGRR